MNQLVTCDICHRDYEPNKFTTELGIKRCMYCDELTKIEIAEVSKRRRQQDPFWKVVGYGLGIMFVGYILGIWELLAEL